MVKVFPSQQMMIRQDEITTFIQSLQQQYNVSLFNNTVSILENSPLREKSTVELNCKENEKYTNLG